MKKLFCWLIVGTSSISLFACTSKHKLTNETLEQHTVVNFSGIDGHGYAKAETTFSNDLSGLLLQASNNGKLKNGDQTTISLTNKAKKQLPSRGYALQSDGTFKVTVSGLATVASQATEIANYATLREMLDSNIKQSCEKQDSSQQYVYEITRKQTLYRQFESTNNEVTYSSWHPEFGTHGALAGIYEVKKFSPDKELITSFIDVFGYSNITLQEDQTADLTKLNTFTKRYTTPYTETTVLQLMLAYGYSEIPSTDVSS